MRQVASGKWWATAGCVGVVIASAFICATLYLGRPEPRVSGLSPGPDPVEGPPGPSLVRRKGYPLPPTTTPPPTSVEVTVTTEAITTIAGDSDQAAGEDIEVVAPPRRVVTSRRPPVHRHRTIAPLLKLPEIDWDEIFNNVNKSLNPRLSQRLTELAELDPVALIKNTSSLVSFGLLAVDLFLLHNVQRIAFNEKQAQPLSQDPEVLALNSLFDGSRQERRQRPGGGVLGEVMGFLQGAVRGVVNLGRAYRRAHRARSVGPTPLDCIWTLYCRSLDKTAKLSGPYGFLAKMNSFGLRLMLGEFSPDTAFEKVMTEMSTGWGKLNCDTLFPRCGVEEAKRVVMATAQADRQKL
ncbi:uncharacterized protein [Halyomorpha halys]|uniref:uncharacterized protein n=1 Tax=Halyomorpha halys TaxID=286706 RepID=UPI0006D50E24|nr:uncharacterized protein LOC106685025 [Halyomorpha halys]